MTYDLKFYIAIYLGKTNNWRIYMEKINEKNKSDSTFVGYLQVALAGISRA